MRLVLSGAVLALWMAETSNTAEAFTLQRFRHSGLSITTMPPSSLHMSTIERPMTAPGSPNSSYSGHPFGSYGKPENNDETNYSYGPPGKVDKEIAANNSHIHDNSYARDKTANSFEAYMQGRNNKSNPSSPSDGYAPRQSSNNNFGAPSTSTPTANNNNNNFGAPPSTPTSPASNNSFANFAASGGSNGSHSTLNNSTNNNFGTPPSTPTQGSSSANFGAPSSTSNFGAPSTPPPAVPNANSYSPPQSTSNNNFGAPSTTNNNFGAPTTTNNNFGAPSTTNSSGTSFPPGGNPSSPPPSAPPSNSFESYMNNRNSNNDNSNSSPSFPGSPASPGSTGGNLSSSIAAAADPSAPLPPYMSPSSLENGSVRSANLPGSANASNGRPDFQPPMPGMGTQPQRSTSASTTTTSTTTSFQQQGPNIAPPLSAPLARVGTPNQKLDIGLPSEELVGRLDQVLTQQQEFSERLDRVDERIDRTTQENIDRTQAMLNSFKEENKKTQETFMNRINGDIHGMRSTMDKVLDEQRGLQQKQQDQTNKFASLEQARSEQAEKLLSLEKTTSIRAQNMEENLVQAGEAQAQRIDALERHAASGGNNGPPGSPGVNNFELERRQNERMSSFERSQIERMAAFEDEQRQKLESALRDYQQSSGARNNGTSSMDTSSPDYMNQQNNPQRPMDETERQLQQRLNEAQARKEELLDQLRDMQRQEDLHMKGGRGSHEDPHSPQRGRDGAPPPPPFASPLDQQMHEYRQQQDRQGSPKSRFNEGSRNEFDGMRQPRFDEVDEKQEVEDEAPRRSMLRDRLGKASEEELYSRNVGAGPRRNLNDENFDDEETDRNMRMDPEEERRMQHERMMRRDPVAPPEAMGPPPRRPGSPAGRYDPRRGGPFGSEQDELAYDISNDSSVRKGLSNMRSFKGDEQLPNNSIFEGGGGGMGGAVDRRGSPQAQQRERRRVPANQGQMGQQQQQQQRRAGGANERHAGLSEPPPPNPMVDKKIEHFLKETLKAGPQPHFDKELENLLIVKYSPLFSWLKPANVAFLRNVVVTYLQHKGCQVEMDLRSAPPKAAREWDELLNILSFELEQRTGEKPRIMEEPDNQWGIYGSKNVRLKISSNGLQQQREQQRRRGGGLSPEQAAQRKRRNDKAFRVSQDPTDPNTRLL